MNVQIKDLEDRGCGQEVACRIWNAAVAPESELYLGMTQRLMDERLVDRSGRPADVCLSAVFGGRTVGLAAASTAPRADSQVANLACVAVLPEARSRGVGSSLLKEVEIRSRSAGRTVLKVDYASPIRLAHGVDPATAGHLWLLRRGFRVFRNQLFMRLDLAGWEMPESVRRVVGDLAASGVDFRVAVDDDLPGLLRVAGQFGEHLAGTFRDNAARGDSYPVLIAAHGDEVLGLVGRLIVSGCGYPDFDLIAVSGPHRGRGIGKALFHICLENFQRRGGRIFELMTSPTNPAQKLYLDAGMRVVTTLVCLEKRLSEGATDPAAPASP